MVDGTQEKLGEEEQEEMKEVSSPPVPILPSREEVLKHRLTHRPFRSWCPHCIKGKSREDKHKQSSQKHVVPNIPKIVSDYFSLAEDGQAAGQRGPRMKRRPPRRARHQS